jgi:alkanesulfonate monooxygenase SsuD/methylene tetrahydromethanopterin reductase-like flavin-dependent oxidoreductase (luciferase family)
LEFVFFHLMPWPDYAAAPKGFPTPNRDFDPKRGQELYDTYIETMIFAEECGFSWVGCNEHHFSPYGLMPNPNLIGSILATRTKSIKIAILGNILPINNPIRVAEEYAMIDVLSGGRLVAGFMRGIPHEFIAYNTPAGESRARQREAAQLIIKAWTEPEPFAWEGEFYQYRSVSIWPRPYQTSPHPPILMSASNPESAVFAAENRAMMGMVFIPDLRLARANIDLYRKTAGECGWEPGPEHILIGASTCIAETDALARQRFYDATEYLNKVLMNPTLDALRLVVQKTRYFQDERVGKGYASRLGAITSFDLDKQIEAGSVLCGSPETVVKQIKRYKNELGNGKILINMQVGNIRNDWVREGMALFRDRVLPEVRAL